VHKLAREKLVVSKSFRGQDKKIIAQVCERVRKEYAILKDYENDWLVCDMLKLHLKYTSEAARRAQATETAKKLTRVSKI